MGLNYVNLDSKTRGYMLLEHDIGNHYASPRIAERRRPEWIALFKEALESHSDDWLASEANRIRLMNEIEYRTLQDGRVISASVPSNAAQQLAEGEFNRFYLRGICARAIAEGQTNLRIYRGRESRNPRPESEAKIGTMINAAALLEELRKNTFVDNVLGLPVGPNSGLTAEIVFVQMQ